MNPISTTTPVQSAVAVTDNGTTVDPSNVATVWSSSDPGIATIDPASGVVTPVAVGQTIIRADCTVTLPNGTTKNVAGLGNVQVTAVGDNLVATVDFTVIP